MALKFSTVSIAAQIAMYSLIFSSTVLAIEPVDLKRVTYADKLYFGNRLTPDQIEKLQQISNLCTTMSKLPYDKKIVIINKTLHFIHVVAPVFRKASTCNGLSSYAKKYSSSVADELARTATVLTELLPQYKKICAAGKQNRHEEELQPK